MPSGYWKPSPRLSCILLPLALHASLCLAQESTPAAARSAPTSSAEPGPYRVAGHILSAFDGHPLQRATVQIFESNSGRQIASVVAGEDGAFAFPGIKAGNFVLQGKATGFLATRYQEHFGFFTGVVTGAGVDTESLLLKLTPEASISGRITDEAGDPVQRANIELYREARATGLTRITPVDVAQTDDTGAYDLPHLLPGKYFLAASATPWYAVHPQPSTPPNSIGVVDAIDPSLDVAYPMTFYPDATDSSSAAPIQLKGGDQLELNLRLTPQPAVRVTIPHLPNGNDTSDPAEQMRSQRANLQQLRFQRQVFDSFEPVAVDMRDSPAGLTYTGLPPGQYQVQQFNAQSRDSAWSATINLTERGTQIDPPREPSLGSLKLQLKASDGASFAPQGSIMLVRTDPNTSMSQPLNEKGEAQVSGIEPGEYHLLVRLGNKQYFVTQLISGGKTLPGKRLQIVAGATLSIAATVSPASASLTGFAQSDGKPVGGAMVLLLPETAIDRASYVARDQSNLDGSFALANIPPGRYTLLAIQDGWDLEWQREDVLAHYLLLGVPIIVPDTGTTKLKLPTPLAVQPR